MTMSRRTNAATGDCIATCTERTFNIPADDVTTIARRHVQMRGRQFCLYSQPDSANDEPILEELDAKSRHHSLRLRQASTPSELGAILALPAPAALSVWRGLLAVVIKTVAVLAAAVACYQSTDSGVVLHTSVRPVVGATGAPVLLVRADGERAHRRRRLLASRGPGGRSNSSGA